MSTKCLVVCDNELMIAGLRALLAKEVAVDIYSLSDHIDEEVAQAVMTLHPDVILMDEHMRESSPAELLRMHQSLPDLRVIIFNERDNKLLVYHDTHFEVGHVQDLADLILNHNFYPRND